MSDEILKGDQNHYRVMAAVTDDSNENIRMLRVDPTTDALVVTGGGGFALNEYNFVSVAYPDSVTEVYTFEMNNITVNTITVVYVDSTKNQLSSVTKV